MGESGQAQAARMIGTAIPHRNLDLDSMISAPKLVCVSAGAASQCLLLCPTLSQATGRNDTVLHGAALAGHGLTSKLTVLARLQLVNDDIAQQSGSEFHHSYHSDQCKLCKTVLTSQPLASGA